MTRDAAELLVPRIALVDDERQIHAQPSGGTSQS